MKTKLIFIAVVISILSFSNIFSQGFTPPEDGKVAIYFVRITSYGFAIDFDFFHQDKYIGTFKKKNYLRYECEPGETLFWASSENKEFITADLKAGGSYIVMVNVIMGAWKARVGLAPIASDHKDFERAKNLIMNNKPVQINTKVIDKETKKLEKRNFMKDNLKKYEDEWKDSKNFKHLSTDMFIPEELMK